MPHQKSNNQINLIALFLLLLSTRSTKSADIECNVRYEQQRTCHCTTLLSRHGQALQPSQPDLSPTTTYEFCDNQDLSYHQCYRADCDSECERSIKNLNGVGETGMLAKEAADSVCKWGVGGGSVTETGLGVWAGSRPGECERRLKEVVGGEAVCCNRRCSCRLEKSGGLLVDLGKWVEREMGPFYECSRSEMGECERECRRVAAEYLEVGVGVVEEVGRNEYGLEGWSGAGDKVCSLVGEQVAFPGLNVELVIDTEPGELSLIKQVSLGKVCCRLVCHCLLKAGTSSQVDLSHMLNLPSLFYDCSSQSAICKQECLRSVDAFLLKPRNPHAYFNLLARNPSTAGDQLCRTLMNGTQVTRPGIDAFLSVGEAGRVFMGKLCCSRPCHCSLIAKNGTQPGVKVLKSFDSLLGKSGFYECGKEESECARDCRRAAGVYLANELMQESSASVQSLNVFFEFRSAVKVCGLMGAEVVEPGVDVYLRYGTGSVGYPVSEDVHVGRVCCNHFLFPANKCKYPLLPDMNG